MKTLKELCEENKLPFKVMRHHWFEESYFEVRAINDLWAVGFMNNGDPTHLALNEEFELYTEPKPKKVFKPFMIRSGGRSVEVEWFESEEVAVKWTFGTCIGPAKGLPDLEVEE